MTMYNKLIEIKNAEYLTEWKKNSPTVFFNKHAKIFQCYLKNNSWGITNGALAFNKTKEHFSARYIRHFDLDKKLPMETIVQENQATDTWLFPHSMYSLGKGIDWLVLMEKNVDSPVFSIVDPRYLVFLRREYREGLKLKVEKAKAVFNYIKSPIFIQTDNSKFIACLMPLGFDTNEILSYNILDIVGPECTPLKAILNPLPSRTYKRKKVIVCPKCGHEIM